MVTWPIQLPWAHHNQVIEVNQRRLTLGREEEGGRKITQGPFVFLDGFYLNNYIYIY